MLRKMKGNTKGGIEGLPLQLMIVILVATMGTAIIIGWMGSIDSPHYIKTLGIEQNTVSIEDGVIGDIYVCVLDENNEPLAGATIIIDNKMVEMPKEFVTGSNGKVTLTGCTLETSYPMSSIPLKIKAIRTGYTEHTETLEGIIK